MIICLYVYMIICLIICNVIRLQGQKFCLKYFTSLVDIAGDRESSFVIVVGPSIQVINDR